MFLAGYTFGRLSTPGNGSSDAVLPIVQCHSPLACAGGETSFQCFQGYADTRCAHKASSQPAVWLMRHRLAPSAREPLQSSLLRGFGCRCGACDVGYYGLSGRCHECGNRILVLFLSRAVPALTILGVTLFLFWGGKVDPKKGESLPLSCRYIRSVDVPSHRGAGVLQLKRQADFWSWSRLWTR